MIFTKGSPSPEMLPRRLQQPTFLLVGLCLLFAAFVQSAQPSQPRASAVSTADDITLYQCPTHCECYRDKRKELWINCTVPYFTKDFETMTSGFHSELTWGLIITCYSYSDRRPQDSVLWDSVFSRLNNLNLLFLDKCSLRTLKSSALTGLTSLQTLIIRGAQISSMDADLMTQLPNLQELEISYSAMTRVFPLCRSETLLTVNLTGNHLTSMEDTGLFCPPGNLSQLERLDVHNNFISDLPDWVSKNLPNLYQLVVADNYILESKPQSLSYFPNLGILDLSNNSFTSFHSRYFEGCRNILILGLSRNKVQHLPRRLLSNMSNIHQLEISEMTLDDRLWMELMDLRRLMHLNMSFNEITSINADIMKQFERLEFFYAHNNKIRDIPRNAFEFQDKLKILMLSNNEITRVPKLAFSERYALKELYLDHNNISLMDAEAISGLENLKILNLSFNSIPYLPIRVFSHLRHLQILDISSNKINSLGHNVFRDTKLLEYFNASHNDISQVPILNNMIYLKTVDISHNNVSGLYGSTFLALRDLRTLLLNGNKLKTLTNKIFKGCDNIRTLDLSHNSLEKIGDSTFSSSLIIENIDLSHNELSNVNYIFSGLDDLKVLNLAFNKLTQILRGQFPKSLEYLDLKHNQIHLISAYTFKSMQDIKMVDVSSNQLKSLDKANVEVAYRLHFQPIFKILYNPFVCDCRLGWLKDYADGRLQDNVPLPNMQMKHSFMCLSPFSQWATRIQNIDRSRFLCNYSNHCEESCMCCDFDSCHCKYQCPSACQCFIGDKVMHVHQVRCNSAQLTAVPLGLPEGATGLWMDGNEIQIIHKHAFLALKHVVELYLNNSQIHSIQNNSFIGLKLVRRLYLQDNFITAIYDVTFKGLDNLEEVYLQNNDIYQIDSTALIAQPFLVRLNLQGNALITAPTKDLEIFVNRSANAAMRPQLFLSGNPWTCESDFSCRFLQFLLTNSEAIQDMRYIECIRPLIIDEDIRKKSRSMGRLVLDLQQDECAENTTTPSNITKARVGMIPSEPEIYAVIAACVIITFIIILVVVGYLNRHFLQVFCFTRFGFRPFKMANAAEDNERPYDAFISYSNKDEDFVIRQLAPRLEKGDKKFKLCVHYRDFPVGACIAETIVRSVEASKRTILVVSDNFLDSEWCRFEFQTAHQQVLTERRNRVILILLHDIDVDKLDSTLKVYMRTRTYLKYDDAWFWEKLMFAMPDIRYRKQQQYQPEITRPINMHHGGDGADVDFLTRDNSGRVSLRSQQAPPRAYLGANGGVGIGGVGGANMMGVGVGGVGIGVGVRGGMPPNGRGGGVLMPESMTNDMYEIPVLDNQSGHYQLANGTICCSSPHHQHTNSAFQPNYNSDTTSGYHNGGSICGSSSAHYEEVGPGGGGGMFSTPQRQQLIDTPPPLPRIPQEGFIPRDKMTFV